MSDEVTSGFTTIEEDNSTTSDSEKHLKIEITDYLGDGSNLRSYVNLGAWSPAAGAGTVTSGQLASAVTDEDGDPDPGTGYTRDETGDDMLAPFLYNLFIDDTRDRGDDDDDTESKVAAPGVDYSSFATPPGLDAVQTDDHQTYGGDDPYYMDADLRAAITKEMPSYVGWRDHTEGHRITTTRGDKIEVIGGNHKLFVLGRGSGTVHTDWSGGHVVDTMEAAGNITSINWRKVPTGDNASERGWLWVEETVKGNIIERFHGTHKTEHYGDEIVEIVGRSDESAPSQASTMGDWASAGLASEGNNDWDADLPDARSKPKVIDMAWITSEYEEMQVDGNLTDIDRADIIDHYMGCKPQFDDDGEVSTGGMGDRVIFEVAEFVTQDSASSLLNSVTLESTSVDDAGTIREYIYADNHAEIVRATTIMEELYAGYYFGRYTKPEGVEGWMDVREVWNGLFFEIFVGMNTQMFAALYSTGGLAIRIEAFLGLETKVNSGLALEAKLVRCDVKLGKSALSGGKVAAAMKEVNATLADLETALGKAHAGLDDTELAAFKNLGPV